MDAELQRVQAELAALKQRNAALERENAKLTLLNARAEEKLCAALDGTGLCLWEQHIPSGNLTIFNRPWGELLGFSREELAAHISSWKQNLHPDDKEWVIKAFEDHVNGLTDEYQAVHRMIHKDGSVSWVSDRGRIIERCADGTPLRIMGTHIDITQEKRYELELAQLALSDPLTHLSNRKAITQTFEEHQAQTSSGGALFFIDLDDFKGINDGLGHKLGDLLLIHVANTLTNLSHSGLNGQSAHCARLGGDEFVVLIPAIDEALLHQFAQTILNVYRQPLELEGQLVSLGLSIGIYRFNHTDTFITCCEYADTAMYQVKKQGKHAYRFWRSKPTAPATSEQLTN